MKEIELKILDINPQDVRKKLLGIGAPTEKEVEELVLKLGYTMKQTTNLTMEELRKQNA